MSGDLHHGADGLSVGEYLAECLGAEDVAQRRLREQLRRPGRVLDVDHRDPRVRDAVVDHRVHGHRHRVLCQYLYMRVHADLRCNHTKYNRTALRRVAFCLHWRRLRRVFAQRDAHLKQLTNSSITVT